MEETYTKSELFQCKITSMNICNINVGQLVIQLISNSINFISDSSNFN